MRPDMAEMIYQKNKPQYKTWFGPHAALLRYDKKWLMADTMLPFKPVKMESITWQ
jgi:hypothetical protein